MKKRGFTLIELLAVIIILAIIALIASPIVMNIIEKSKKGAAERSAENYIDAVEITATRQLMKGKELEGTYQVQEDENLCPTAGCGENDVDKITIEVSGNKPKSGSITITNGQVISGILCIGGNKVKYDENGIEIIGTCGTEICWLVSGKALEIGSKYECAVKEGKTQIFYVLEDGDTTELKPETGGIATPGTVSLIMDRNLGNRVAWVTKADYIAAGGTESDYGNDGNNNLGPITAMNYLKEQTSDWIVEANLPTQNQIYQAAGNKSSGFPTWLYDYLQYTTHPVSGLHGYWTTDLYLSSRAMHVRYDGSLYNVMVNNYFNYGVRPVITISKSELL